MTGTDRHPGGEPEMPTRRATITTTHGDASTAERIAAALRPDNTAELDARTDGDRVVARVVRGTTGGLRATVDDYVVNATVAAQLSTAPDRDADADTGTNDTHS